MSVIDNNVCQESEVCSGYKNCKDKKYDHLCSDCQECADDAYEAIQQSVDELKNN